MLGVASMRSLRSFSILDSSRFISSNASKVLRKDKSANVIYKESVKGFSVWPTVYVTSVTSVFPNLSPKYDPNINNNYL
jgi:hypothetical protein